MAFLIEMVVTKSRCHAHLRFTSSIFGDSGSPNTLISIAPTNHPEMVVWSLDDGPRFSV
jgi:hypothetical protein